MKRREELPRTLLLCGIMLLGCTAFASPIVASVPAPGGPPDSFQVHVTFSKKALLALRDRKETVVVLAMFSAKRNESPSYHPFADNDPEDLGTIKREILPDQTARFDDVHLKLNRRPGETQLLINVVSGRKSSKDNLLQCGIYEGPLRDVRGTTIPIACRLIQGDDPSN
jgi:hypothetical protein